MQRIKHEQKNVHPVFDDIEHLYALTSTKNSGGTLIPPLFDVSFQSIFELFRDYGGVDYQIDYVKKSYQKLNLPKYDPKNIIVCFSGGKDSIATAMHYKTIGYNVCLYHVTGLNKTYYDEWKYAKRSADKMNLPLIIEDMSYSGTPHEWIEHPIKNMILTNMAVQWGIRNQVGTKIATGNFRTSSIEDDVFEICAGDTQEFWRAYEKIIQRIIKPFRIYTPNLNYQTAFFALLKHPDLIESAVSCLASNRFRKQRHDWNEEKYNQHLPENRCGSCWKCAVEYIWFTDHGVFEFNEPYYHHCLDILQRTLRNETGRFYSLYTTWRQYFFYNMNKSKYWRLHNGVIL